MVNPRMFASNGTDTLNDAGGIAYKLPPEKALAQLAFTGCLNNTFYASAEDQLKHVETMAQACSDEFIAKLAIAARTSGYMKDMPALLCAILRARNPELLSKIFLRVVDSGKMLRNFIQIVRSGRVCKKNVNGVVKRLVQKWFDVHDAAWIYRNSVGQKPSMADIIKMCHPKPNTPTKEALFGYLIGKNGHEGNLPSLVRHVQAFHAGLVSEIPQVPHLLLTGSELTPGQWSRVAQNASWQTLRMNLNTFHRHGVFDASDLVASLANKLRSPELIKGSRVFPYQLLSAYKAADPNIPRPLVDALHDAMEIAVDNIPSYEGRVVVCPDVSGSMRMPITGARGSATSKVRCVDVAALFSAAILRKNPTALCFPFDHRLHAMVLEPRDTVMTIAKQLASCGGGATACSLPLAHINDKVASTIRPSLGSAARGWSPDLVIYISDNESWAEFIEGTFSAWPPAGYRGKSASMAQWQRLKKRNPGARLVIIDLCPHTTSQVLESQDILMVGGFSDHVFDLIASFASGELSGSSKWIDEISVVEI